MPCLVPGCQNNAPHNVGVRLRRPDTSAIWAPNCDAFLCDTHAASGATVEVVITTNNTATLTTNVSANGGAPVTRTTPIKNSP